MEGQDNLNVGSGYDSSTGSSPLTNSRKVPRKSAKKEAKKEEKELRKVEKMKVLEEKQKQKQEELKLKQEEKEAKKERDMKKKIERKIRKKLATPYGDVSHAAHSLKSISSGVLADYELEATTYKQIDTYFSDLNSKISKNNQKLLSVLDERKSILKDLSDTNVSKDRNPILVEAIQQLTSALTFQTELLTSFYNSFQIVPEKNQDDKDIPKDVSNESRDLKREYYKLLDRYEEIEAKIHATTKEKAVSAAAMEKLTEAEQTRELIQNRVKQLGEIMLMQQKNNSSLLISQSLQFIIDTLKNSHRTYTDGLTFSSQQLDWINNSEDKLINFKEELEGQLTILDERIVELGTDKRFDQIIKKKSIKDKQKDDVSLSKSPVLHVATSEGALEMVKTILDGHPEYLDLQDPNGWAPLHVACSKGHSAITKELLIRGASLSSLTDTGDTPLHLACSKGNGDCIDIILILGKDIILLDIPNKDGFTPLHLSVKSGSTSIFKKLIHRDFDLAKSGPDGSAKDMIEHSGGELYSEFMSIIQKFESVPDNLKRSKPRIATNRRDTGLKVSTKIKTIPNESSIKQLKPDFAQLNDDDDKDTLVRSAIEEWENEPIISTVHLTTTPLSNNTPSVSPNIIRKRPNTPLPPPPDSSPAGLRSSPPQKPTGPLPPPPSDAQPIPMGSKNSPQRPTCPLPPPPIDEISTNSTDVSIEDSSTTEEKIELKSLNIGPNGKRVRSKSLTLSMPPSSLGSKSSESLNAKNISSSNDGKNEECSNNVTSSQQVRHSNEVFEFVAQKRSAKTYKYNRRKLVIFQEKLTVYKRSKVHKEHNTKNLLQCARSIKYPRKIKLLWRFNKKVEKYLFSSTEQRERFYEAIFVSQHGLNYFPYMSSNVTLNIFVGTWNMGNAAPPAGLDSWLQQKMNYDMYVIGLQESDYPDAKDNNTTVESHLLRFFSSHLGKQYVKLVGLSLWEIRMFIFVKRDHYQAISNVKTGSLACGVAGVMANKGGVGASFRFHESTMAFVCSHLAAHQNKTEDRNEHFRAIVRGLTPSIRQINNTSIDITNQFDHLFWIGDLNYRIELPREEVMEFIAEKNWNALLRRDQLKREIEQNTAFMNFEEEIIVFKPTYKFSIGSSSEYSEEKPVRVPAWCDRILWKTLPRDDLSHESYGSCDEITTSDHHPVFATFKLTTRLGNLPSKRIEGFRIILQKLSISELRFAYNDGVPSPNITFLGPFLESAQKTSSVDKTRNPEWDTIVELIPIITNRDCLLSQSLRVVVGDKGKIVQEKHRAQRCAQTVIPLAALNKQPTYFEQPLTSWGYGDCGILRGEIFIDFAALTKDEDDL